MIALAMVGKMVATAAYAVVYLFTAELFPTVIRSVMINLSSFAGSLGNIVAPYIVVLVCIIVSHQLHHLISNTVTHRLAAFASIL